MTCSKQSDWGGKHLRWDWVWCPTVFHKLLICWDWLVLAQPFPECLDIWMLGPKFGVNIICKHPICPSLQSSGQPIRISYSGPSMLHTVLVAWWSRLMMMCYSDGNKNISQAAPCVSRSSPSSLSKQLINALENSGRRKFFHRSLTPSR